MYQLNETDRGLTVNTNNFEYKVCILAAGVGQRMGAVSDYINKAVLPVNYKGVISYIVEKFPENIETVIAVGHKKETIMDYVSLAHPERKFTFVDIDKFVGPGTGPGYSLLQCKKELQCPFIFSAADTIVLEDIQPPAENWFGVAPVDNTERFCSVKIKNNLIYQIDDKVKTNNRYAFIGLAGIKDYGLFFSALEKNRESISGEIQVSNGFKKLIEKRLIPFEFTWSDTGTLTGYKETNRNFSGSSKDFDFSKGEEFIYFVNDKVIKFFANEDIIKGRCKRAELLDGTCPKIEGVKKNFYSYTKIEGQTLYNVLNNKLFLDFLNWCKTELWKVKKLSSEDQEKFYSACKKFYHDKTMKRINLFYEKTKIVDAGNDINGIDVPPLKDLLKKVDWEQICKGMPANFHGDLQFDNVLVTRSDVSQLQKFILLDWRQDFGGIVTHGDVYYDLAKLYGGMILSYQLIKKGLFSFDISGSNVYYNFQTKNDLVDAKELYETFLKENGYDLNKIRVLTSLIFLNMSPLHNDPFDLMLYYLGKNMLNKSLNRIR